MIKARPGRTRKRYQPSGKALLKAGFEGACMGALIAFVWFKLWPVLQSAV